jgi:hypothetical protein
MGVFNEVDCIVEFIDYAMLVDSDGRAFGRSKYLLRASSLGRGKSRICQLYRIIMRMELTIKR